MFFFGRGSGRGGEQADRHKERSGAFHGDQRPPPSQDREGQAIAAADRQRPIASGRGAAEQEERERAKKDDRIAAAAAVQQVGQIESDQAVAHRLRREMEEEEAAKLAEQERLARKLQGQMEEEEAGKLAEQERLARKILEEERAAMADIRAAQEKSVQRRQGFDPHAQSLVSQVSLASSARLRLFIFLPARLC
jgi:hypothetical protein